MTEISKLMRTNADGTESQVYPETHPEAVVGLDGYIATHGGSGGTGAKGDTGATGPAGPKGDTGAVGPQGPAGSTAIATQTANGLMSSADKKKLDGMTIIKLVKVKDV